MFFYFPQRVELITRHRLLENFHAMIRQAFSQANRGFGVIGFIGVDFDEYIIANRLTHGGDTGQILVYFAADLELSDKPSRTNSLASSAIASGAPTLTILMTLISFR